MADHNKKGVPLTIRPLTAFFLPCERVHVWVLLYGPFSGTAVNFTIDSCSWKKVIETPVSEWVMYLKGWLTWISFSFARDWFGEWLELSGPIAKRS